MNSTFHSGELAVQTQAGVAEIAQRVGNSIGNFIPDVAEFFLREQHHVIITSIDTKAQVWVSILTADAGFLQVLDKSTVHISAIPTPDDPLFKNILTHSEVGLIAIDYASRRRMRLNGKAEVKSDGTLIVSAEQVYSNCPKYIQARSIKSIAQEMLPASSSYSTQFTEAQQRWIAKADTFFIGTANPAHGADASHRGGQAGFITVESRDKIIWPDYAGNMMFNTLGNIAINPNTGLLFLDFEQGRTLQLTGTAEVIWDGAEISKHKGAQRLVSFHLTKVIEKENALPLQWQFESYSPYNP